MLNPVQMGDRPIAVEAVDVHKSFRVPSRRMDTLKERVLHALSPVEYTTFEALRGLSFKVAEGECFGVVGRNGSGKTTLLKLLASIYRLDRGRIRVAGTLAPFIELAVGFNPNLTARDNVLLNGVMMGATPKEARRRFDEVLEFSELEEFVELPIKNYSSGMAMRLGFSLMVLSEADVMLVDEVLAVGDAAFAQKCAEVFDQLRQQGRTIVLVTHDMDSLQAMCDHAILIENGVIDLAGEPDAVANRYFQINLAGPEGPPPVGVDGSGARGTARITGAWLEDIQGKRARRFERGNPIHLCVDIDVERRIERPVLSFEVCAADGTQVFCAPAALAEDTGRLEAGERLSVRIAMPNPFTAGKHIVNCALSQNGIDEIDLRRPGPEFTVAGKHEFGYVELDWTFEIERQSEVSPVEAADG